MSLRTVLAPITPLFALALVLVVAPGAFAAEPTTPTNDEATLNADSFVAFADQRAAEQEVREFLASNPDPAVPSDGASIDEWNKWSQAVSRFNQAAPWDAIAAQWGCELAAEPLFNTAEATDGFTSTGVGLALQCPVATGQVDFSQVAPRTEIESEAGVPQGLPIDASASERSVVTPSAVVDSSADRVTHGFSWPYTESIE